MKTKYLLCLLMLLNPIDCFGQVADLMKKTKSYGSKDIQLVDESQLEQRVEDLESRVASIENRLNALESKGSTLSSTLSSPVVSTVVEQPIVQTKSWGSSSGTSSGGCTGNASTNLFSQPVSSYGGGGGSTGGSLSSSMFTSSPLFVSSVPVAQPRPVERRRTVRVPITEVQTQNVRYEALDCSDGTCRVPARRGVAGALRSRLRGF